ncbi:MAG: hypothetical protein WCV58_00025 [Patescibacteria group bacterium]
MNNEMPSEVPPTELSDEAVNASFQQGGPVEEESEEKSSDGAYWWFVNLFDPAASRVHLEEVGNLSRDNYDKFAEALADQDRRKLMDIQTSGIKNGDDKNFIETMARGFSSSVESKSGQE